MRGALQCTRPRGLSAEGRMNLSHACSWPLSHVPSVSRNVFTHGHCVCRLATAPITGSPPTALVRSRSAKGAWST
eukprot:804572-Prymnesium_polylepis.1